MIEKVVDWLINLVESVGPLGLLIATAVESLIAPIPSEIVLITAGLSVSENGNLVDLVLMIFCATLGSFLGTLPFYYFSRIGSKSFIPKFVDRYGMFLLIKREDIMRVENFFNKKGGIAVLLARLIPGIRSLISIPAGVAKMNFVSYTFYTMIGSGIWNTFLISIGYFGYDYKDEFFNVLNPIEDFVIVLLFILFVLYLFSVVKAFYKSR